MDQSHCCQYLEVFFFLNKKRCLIAKSIDNKQYYINDWTKGAPLSTDKPDTMLEHLHFQDFDDYVPGCNFKWEFDGEQKHWKIYNVIQWNLLSV